MPMDSEPRQGRPAMLQSGAVGWLCTTSLAMGGVNQSRSRLAARRVGLGSNSGQGHPAVPLPAASSVNQWYLPPQSVPWSTAPGAGARCGACVRLGQVVPVEASA